MGLPYLSLGQDSCILGPSRIHSYKTQHGEQKPTESGNPRNRTGHVATPLASNSSDIEAPWQPRLVTSSLCATHSAYRRETRELRESFAETITSTVTCQLLFAES